MPSVLRRSSSLRSYKNDPSIAASAKHSRYCPKLRLSSQSPTSATLHAATSVFSWPGILPSSSFGINLVPPPVPPTEPSLIAAAALAPLIIVLTAPTFRIARTMLRLEKYVKLMDMNPNFISDSVDSIRAFACCCC